METHRRERLPARERILGVARRRFEQFGYRRTGIAEIARDAGLAAGTIYSHFDGKEDLFLEVVERENAAWLETARGVLARPGSAPARLAALANASARFYGRSELLLAVLRRDRDIVSAPILDELHERLLKQNVELMAQVIARGIEEGSLRPIDPELAAYILFVTGHALFNQSHHPYAELAPVLAQLALRGLAS